MFSIFVFLSIPQRRKKKERKGGREGGRKEGRKERREGGREGGRKEGRKGESAARIQLLTSCVTLGKVLNLSGAPEVLPELPASSHT
jgi:hypothetical protein